MIIAPALTEGRQNKNKKAVPTAVKASGTAYHECLINPL